MFFRGGFPSRRELIERLEGFQRDLEQQLADVADVLAHLRDREREPAAAADLNRSSEEARAEPSPPSGSTL